MSETFKTHVRLPCGCVRWLFGSTPCSSHRPKGPRTVGWSGSADGTVRRIVTSH